MSTVTSTTRRARDQKRVASAAQTALRLLSSESAAAAAAAAASEVGGHGDNCLGLQRMQLVLGHSASAHGEIATDTRTDDTFSAKCAAFVLTTRASSESARLSDNDLVAATGYGCVGRCGGCSALLFPGLSCKVGTSRPQRGDGLRRVRFSAVCAQCGARKQVGQGSSRVNKRLAANDTVSAKRLKGKHKGSGPKYKVKNNSGAISLESARAMGVLAAAQRNKGATQQLSLLEQLASEKDQQGPAQRQERQQQRHTGSLKRVRDSFVNKNDNNAKFLKPEKQKHGKKQRNQKQQSEAKRIEEKKSTLAGFLSALRK